MGTTMEHFVCIGILQRTSLNDDQRQSGVGMRYHKEARATILVPI